MSEFFKSFLTNFLIILIVLVCFALLSNINKSKNIEITLQDDERCSNINEVLNPALLKDLK